MLYIILLLLLVNIYVVYSTELTDLYFKGHESNNNDKVEMNAGRKLHLNTSASCGYEATCTYEGYDGLCQSISQGCCSGTVTSNLCPGSSDIRCCTKSSCSTPSGSGTCIQTSACKGTSVAGYCAGPSDIQCCVEGASSCSTPVGSGTCIQTSECTGTSVQGYCPGGSDIQCCVEGASSCSTPVGSGTCIQTSACTGTSVPGYCGGGSDIQCCVKSSSSAHFGIDISSTLSSSTASCLASTYSFIIPRGYESLGQVDTRVCASLESAYNAGIKTRDVYLFPCPTCSITAAEQVTTLVNYLNSNCKSYWSGRIWLDIEGTQYWLGSSSLNQNFYKQLVDACVGNGPCGVYSSYYQWESLFGSTSFCYGQDLHLWYAHYDNNPSFSDFSTFGCWKSPYIKQFQGDVTKCSLDVDTSYSPYAV